MQPFLKCKDIKSNQVEILNASRVTSLEFALALCTAIDDKYYRTERGTISKCESSMAPGLVTLRDADAAA